MTQLGIDTAGLLFRLHRTDDERRAITGRARQHTRVVSGFVVGAVLRAVVTSYVNFWGAAVSLVVISLAARVEYVHASRTSLTPNVPIQ